MAELVGTVHTSRIMGNERRFAEVTLPYHQAVEVAMAVRFNAATGRGEQRGVVDKHLKKLMLAMEMGDYTPAPGTLSLRPSHRSRLVIDGDQFCLEVDPDDPLALTDGGHRVESLTRLVKKLSHRLSQAEGEGEREIIRRQLEETRSTPITFTVLLDGDPQLDFLNLQAGQAVDAVQMFSMRVKNNRFGDPAFQTAALIAQHLNADEKSPFYRQICFDSRSKANIRVTSLCARNPSDRATSLIGLAEVGASADRSVEWMASCLNDAVRALNKNAPELTVEKMVLTTPTSCSAGSAAMLAGLAICLAFRANLTRRRPDDYLGAMVQAAKHTLFVNCKLSAPDRRRLIGDFARLFFDREKCEKHDGIPLALLQTMTPSAYDAEKLPPKPRVRKPKAPKATKAPRKPKAVKTQAADRGDDTLAFAASEQLRQEVEAWDSIPEAQR